MRLAREVQMVAVWVSRTLTCAIEDKIMGTLLLIILVLLLLGAVPAWPHSRSWGYYPSGGIGLLLVILLVLAIMGRVPLGF